ncbi:MAG: hypothetical protein ACOYOI_06975 [Chthoniobacterales bacterium]
MEATLGLFLYTSQGTLLSIVIGQCLVGLRRSNSVVNGNARLKA